MNSDLTIKPECLDQTGNHYSSLIPDTDELGERGKLFKKKSKRLDLNLHRDQSSSNVPSF